MWTANLHAPAASTAASSEHISNQHQQQDVAQAEVRLAQDVAHGRCLQCQSYLFAFIAEPIHQNSCALVGQRCHAQHPQESCRC